MLLIYNILSFTKTKPATDRFLPSNPFVVNVWCSLWGNATTATSDKASQTSKPEKTHQSLESDFWESCPNTKKRGKMLNKHKMKRQPKEAKTWETKTHTKSTQNPEKTEKRPTCQDSKAPDHVDVQWPRGPGRASKWSHDNPIAFLGQMFNRPNFPGTSQNCCVKIGILIERAQVPWGV